ncbi:MAG: hypothetical protein UIH99_01840, partial [Alphaproteobacteria bacterium]|nr:hypothetical protein [Alphaproteobacteria bacterium]
MSQAEYMCTTADTNTGRAAGKWDVQKDSCTCPSGYSISAQGACMPGTAYALCMATDAKTGQVPGIWDSTNNKCTCPSDEMLEKYASNVASKCRPYGYSSCIDSGGDWNNVTKQCDCDYGILPWLQCKEKQQHDCEQSGGTWEDETCDCGGHLVYNEKQAACGYQLEDNQTYTKIWSKIVENKVGQDLTLPAFSTWQLKSDYKPENCVYTYQKNGSMVYKLKNLTIKDADKQKYTGKFHLVCAKEDGSLLNNCSGDLINTKLSGSCSTNITTADDHATCTDEAFIQKCKDYGLNYSIPGCYCIRTE